MITESQIAKALRDIERLILEGYSIQLARKKVCYNGTGRLTRAVMATEGYLILLNYYESKRGHGNTFVRGKDGKIKAIKGKKCQK